METVLLILAIGTLNVVCFFIGAKVGQKVVNGETLEIPNPVEMIREHNDRREAEREAERLEIIMQNIENYDGTGSGQQDVPRG